MKLVLKDGSRLSIVQPNLWDSAQIEIETGWNRKEYAKMMKLGSMQTAAAIFATLRRAGHDVTFASCAELDAIETVVAEPGDLARAEESEGEESPGPQIPESVTPEAEPDESATGLN